MSVRILVVDDHPVVRTGLRAVLEAEPDFEVVDETESGRRAVTLAHRLRPDVVLTDLLLPDLDGIAVTQSIRAQLPEIRVVVLTSVSDQDRWVVRAIRAGAIGCVMKSSHVSELVQAIRQAADGHPHMTPQAAARLMQEVQSPTHPVRLTHREREVLRELAIGRTNKEIARSLNVALTTVKSHVRTILEKLGVESRTQAALYAARTQITSGADLEAA